MREGNPAIRPRTANNASCIPRPGFATDGLQTKGRMPAAEGDSLLGVSALA